VREGVGLLPVLSKLSNCVCGGAGNCRPRESRSQYLGGDVAVATTEWVAVCEGCAKPAEAALLREKSDVPGLRPADADPEY
jgi:hypothetical protein